MSPRLSRDLPPTGREDGDSVPLVTAPHSITLTPPHQGTKAVAGAGASVWWPVASAKLCSRLAVAASAHGRVGGTAGRETAHPSLSLEA